MWVVIGLGLLILASLLLIFMALHEDFEETFAAIFLFGFLSIPGTIIITALNEWKVPSKAEAIESAQIGLVVAFCIAVVGLLALIVSAPFRMISRAIAARHCPLCVQHHVQDHRTAEAQCPECIEYHELDHETEYHELDDET